MNWDSLFKCLKMYVWNLKLCLFTKRRLCSVVVMTETFPPPFILPLVDFTEARLCKRGSAWLTGPPQSSWWSTMDLDLRRQSLWGPSARAFLAQSSVGACLGPFLDSFLLCEIFPGVRGTFRSFAWCRQDSCQRLERKCGRAQHSMGVEALMKTLSEDPDLFACNFVTSHLPGELKKKHFLSTWLRDQPFERLHSLHVI